MEMVKDTAAFPFKYKVTFLSLSVWKYIHEDSVVRIREKRELKKSSRIGNNSLFQECYCSRSEKPRAYKNIKQKLKPAEADNALRSATGSLKILKGA